MSQRLLYQFPISHYCEKVRWQLDAKGLPYQVRNLLPGPHGPFARRVAGSRTLPILREGERYLADSTHIGLYLEQAYPASSLLPADDVERARVLELESYFDEMGAHVRRWMYGYLISAPNLKHIMFDAYDPPQRLAGYLLLPLIKVGLKRLYRLQPHRVNESRERMLEGLGRLEGELGHDAGRFLVGSTLSLADISAAAMYAPLVGPEGSPWERDELPGLVGEMRQFVRERVAGHWVLRLYRDIRHASLRR